MKAFKVLENFIEERHASAGVALVGARGKQFAASYGQSGFFPGAEEVTHDTIFDIASLTKVVATTTIVLSLIDAGYFDLETELGALPLSVPKDKADLSIRQLMLHTAGLAPTGPFYLDASGSAEVISRILASPLEYELGTKVVYSCLGFIILAELATKLTGKSFDKLVSEKITIPLAMADTCFNPQEELLSRIAYTEWCHRRREFLRGIVHDENAQGLAGVAGNAGLFSTAFDLAKFAEMILRDGKSETKTILSENSLDLLSHSYTDDLEERRTLGWMMPGSGYTSAGSYLSASSLGHTGFTGTSLWIDRERKLYVVLLTNRVHPTRDNLAHIQLRPVFHDAVLRELGYTSQRG